ncbi:hypothetical protein A2165_02765 [Candidatus Curtissbacteria bacterium RBG_13_40_7]|uniref:Uncharacterized protein n=1 Tax=Candidatus Curtissbacteria bacterium RBG_13_40_7 TaxID=1797706 RepID=A0A1F5FV90_9BACT|nr:MAG: hypothetical protein A2165_02765 [Candidatus Curtissbacteria bacterium RBG_13_40_7]
MEETIAARRKKLIRDGILIILSILLAVVVYQAKPLEGFLYSISGINFLIGALLAGVLFSSTFTVAIASSIFLLLSETHSIFIIALVGGIGAFVGDSLIFKFMRDDLIADFEYLEKHFGPRIAKRIFHSKLIFWFLPIIAAFVIASPLPDEVGLLMLASIKLKYHRFFLLSFLLNTTGILILSLIGKTL